MTEKRFTYDSKTVSILKDGEFWLDGQIDTACNHSEICNELNQLNDENEQLKAQLYCDDEEGVCNVCKHHYLIKDDESELGYYNSRCKKGHNYECARVSLKHCKDFEKELKE